MAAFSLFGLSVTWYGLLAGGLTLCGGACLTAVFKKRGFPAGSGALFYLLGALLGVLLGRGVYCLVRYDIFEDAMGRSLGIGPFFDLRVGSLSVIGVILGALLGGWIAAKGKGISAAAAFDAAAAPGLFLFAALRLIEPLSGQGYGPLLETRALSWFPLAIQNGWGDWSLSVCFLEAVILLVIGLSTVRLKTRRSGTRILFALTLLAACQIVPESLRRDDALRIFIFARVTQIGYAVLLVCAAGISWGRAAARGVGRKTIWGECGLVLLGIVLLIAGEFALDKTRWPDGLIYAVMLAILGLMTALILRRTMLEDGRPSAAKAR